MATAPRTGRFAGPSAYPGLLLPQDAGLCGSWFLRLPGGRTVAYTEHGYGGELFECSAVVEHMRRAYDAMRDVTLSLAESRKFVLRMLEELLCDSST